jgi:hypothetical protein
MTVARVYRIGSVLLALAITACASAPVALVALPPAPAAATRDAGPGASVLVREVTVPGYLDGRAGRTQFGVPLPNATPSAVAAATTEALARFADMLVEAMPAECRAFAQDMAGARR